MTEGISARQMESSVPTSQALAPLVIGVTGHRDLRDQDREPLERRVRSLLLELKAKYPFTPLVLLSALAEGADRLVARIALEPSIEARLVAPLPMPRHCYEEDFPGSLEEFRALLEKAERSFELPLHEGNTEEGLRQPEQRAKQYQDVGEFIAGESQILVALWDGAGAKTNPIGGTAQVVQFQIEGVPSAEDCDLEPHECFPVYQILTPRMKNPNPMGEPFTLHKIYPKAFGKDESGAEEYYAEMLERLDEFNRNVAQANSALIERVNASKTDIFAEVSEAGSQRITLERYAFADALAEAFQTRMIWTQKILHWSVFLAFACFVFYAHLPKLRHAEVSGHRPWWLCASTLFLLCGYYFYLTARKRDLETNYQDYRAVAEGMRVKLFWELSGIAGRVTAYYLTKQRTELDWICNVLRGWYCLDPKEAIDDDLAGGDSLDSNGIQLAVSRWVDAQREYFKEAAERDRRKSELLEARVQLSLGAAALTAFVLTVITFIAPLSKVIADNEWLHGLPLIVIELLLAAGALLHHYNERMAFSQHAKQYSRMRIVFEHALVIVNDALESKNYRRARTCLWNLGREALAENGEWVLIHRERPLELPHP